MGLIYASIRVKDLKKSIAFYTKQMGMRVEWKQSWVPGETAVGLVAKDSKQRLNLMHYVKGSEHYTPFKEGSEMDHLMFKVKDAKKEYNRLVAKGAPIAMKLWEDDGFAMGFVKDPNGIWIGLKSG